MLFNGTNWKIWMVYDSVCLVIEETKSCITAIPRLFFSTKKISIIFSLSFHRCCLCGGFPGRKGNSLKTCTLSSDVQLKKTFIYNRLCVWYFVIHCFCLTCKKVVWRARRLWAWISVYSAISMAKLEVSRLFFFNTSLLFLFDKSFTKRNQKKEKCEHTHKTKTAKEFFFWGGVGGRQM